MDIDEHFAEELEKGIDSILSGLDLVDEKIYNDEQKDALKLMSEAHRHDLENQKVYSIACRSLNNEIRELKPAINSNTEAVNNFRNLAGEVAYDFEQQLKKRAEQVTNEVISDMQAQFKQETDNICRRAKEELKPVKTASYAIYACTIVNFILLLIHFL